MSVTRWELAPGFVAEVTDPDTHFLLTTPLGYTFRGSDLMLTVVCNHCHGWLTFTGTAEEFDWAVCAARCEEPTMLFPGMVSEMDWDEVLIWTVEALTFLYEPLEAHIVASHFEDITEELHRRLDRRARKLIDRSFRSVGIWADS